MTVSFEKPIKNQRQKVARQNRKHSFLYISSTRTHLFHHIKNENNHHNNNTPITSSAGGPTGENNPCVHYRISKDDARGE